MELTAFKSSKFLQRMKREVVIIKKYWSVLYENGQIKSALRSLGGVLATWHSTAFCIRTRKRRTHLGRVQVPLLVRTEHGNVRRIGFAAVLHLAVSVGPAVQLDVARLPVEREVGQVESAQRSRCPGNPVQRWTVRVDNNSVYVRIEHVFAIDAVDAGKKGTSEKLLNSLIVSCLFVFLNFVHWSPGVMTED